MRNLYVLGFTWSAACLALLLAPRSRERFVPHPPAAAWSGPAAGWFAAAKPFCNALEVDTRLQYAPPPEGWDGAGYGAACFALAGRIDSARARIRRLPAGERARASGIVFQIGHPVADAGDDRSAGPMMELVLEFWPDNYMALYHAGMSAYALGRPGPAADYLRRFLQLYQLDDGWTRNARTVLTRMGAG